METVELMIFHAVNRRNKKLVERLRVAHEMHPYAPVIMVTGIRPSSPELSQRGWPDCGESKDFLKRLGVHYIDLTSLYWCYSSTIGEDPVRKFTGTQLA